MFFVRNILTFFWLFWNFIVKKRKLVNVAAIFNFFLEEYLHFFQPVYKQLAVEWQIAKKLSGLNPLSPSNN